MIKLTQQSIDSILEKFDIESFHKLDSLSNELCGQNIEIIKEAFLKENIKIDGHKGTWYVIAERLYPETKGSSPEYEQLFLVESEQYGDEASWLVINDKKEVLLDECFNGWTDYDYVRDNDFKAYVNGEHSQPFLNE